MDARARGRRRADGKLLQAAEDRSHRLDANPQSDRLAGSFSHVAPMKEAGRIRYIGITHYTESAFADLEAVMRAEPLDFVQLNYSAGDRAAERRLLPLAAERGIAVIVNYPLASGAAVRAVSSRPLPAWAADI